jgi:SH3-like domain-containing protein
MNLNHYLKTEDMNMSEELKMDELEGVSGGASAERGHVLIVNCEHACNVRTGPGKQYAKLSCYAYAGNIYSYYAKENGWYLLQISGKLGWVYKEFISVIN